MTESKHWCPVCDAGWVVPMQVGAHHGLLCQECEAWWPQPIAIKAAEHTPTAEGWVQFSTWLREEGSGS